MDTHNAGSFAAYVRTHRPPRFDGSDARTHPFYHNIRQYIAHITSASLGSTDLRPAFTHLAQCVFTCIPRLSETCTGDIGISAAVDGAHFAVSTINEVADWCSTEEEAVPQTFASCSHPVAPVSRPNGHNQSDDTPLSVPGKTGMWITGAAVTISAAGHKESWKVAGLVSEVSHYPLACMATAVLSQARAVDALAQSLHRLAKAWDECGTCLGLVMLNSRFSRLCVLETSQGSVSYTPLSLEITIALEVPRALLRRRKYNRVTYSEIVELKVINPLQLLAQDLIASYPSDRPFLDMCTFQYTISHAAARRLWSTVERSVNILMRQPWGRPLERIATPHSTTYNNYVNHLLDNSIARPDNGPRSRDRNAETSSSDDAEIQTPTTQTSSQAGSMQELCTGQEVSPLNTGSAGARPRPKTLRSSLPARSASRRKTTSDEASLERWRQDVVVDLSHEHDRIVSPAERVASPPERRIMVRLVSADEMDRLHELRCSTDLCQAGATRADDDRGARAAATAAVGPGADPSALSCFDACRLA